MKATAQQKEAIKKAVRAANRRVERAEEKYPGMANYLHSIITRSTGAPKFSAKTKGLTYEQAAKKIEELNRFMEKDITKITSWKKEKKEEVRLGNKALKAEGYDLTDEEFGEILEQVDADKKDVLYEAVNKVQAKKVEMEKEAAEDPSKEKWSGTPDQISSAISEKIAEKFESQAALEKAIAARPQIDARRKKK